MFSVLTIFNDQHLAFYLQTLFCFVGMNLAMLSDTGCSFCHMNLVYSLFDTIYIRMGDRNSQGSSGEEKFRSIFENVVDEILISDVTGKILDVNGRCFDIFGYTQDEVIGKNFLTAGYITAKDLPKLVKILQQLIRGEVADPVLELETIHKDGHLVYVEVRAKILKENGKISGILAIIRDITNWKKDQNQIIKMAAVVENSPNLINIALLDGTMIFLNLSGQKILGINSTDVVTKNILEVIDESCLQKVKDELLPKLRNKENWEGELRYVNLQTKKTFDVYATCFSILDKQKNELLYFANISNEIGRQKLAEMQLNKEMNNLRIVNETTVERELKMIDLKKQVKILEEKLAKFTQT